MSNNKLDPVHAVASLALSFVEVQRQLSMLQRQFAELSTNVAGMDNALRSKFRSIDEALGKCLNFLTAEEEVPNAIDSQGEEGDGQHEEDVRSQEGEERVLCDDKRGEAEGSGGQEEARLTLEDIL